MPEPSDVAMIPIEKLHPNPWNRKVFDPKEIQSLVNTIKAWKVQEPLIVRPQGDEFQIASGQRRWMAAKEAGLKELPCSVQNLTDEQVQDMNILLNIQREDISPLELARMIKSRMDSGNLTQEQVAQMYGKYRTWVTDVLGVLDLPQEVLNNVEISTLSLNAIKNLKTLPTPEHQIQVSKEIKKGILKPKYIGKRVKQIREEEKSSKNGGNSVQTTASIIPSPNEVASPPPSVGEGAGGGKTVPPPSKPSPMEGGRNGGESKAPGFLSDALTALNDQALSEYTLGFGYRLGNVVCPS